MSSLFTERPLRFPEVWPLLSGGRWLNQCGVTFVLTGEHAGQACPSGVDVHRPFSLAYPVASPGRLSGKSAKLSPLGSHFSPLSPGGLHAWQRRFWSACPGLKDRLSGTRLPPTHLMVTLLSLSEAYVCMFRDPTSDPHVGRLLGTVSGFAKPAGNPPEDPTGISLAGGTVEARSPLFLQ